jgi:hypothetical protein
MYVYVYNMLMSPVYFILFHSYPMALSCHNLLYSKSSNNNIYEIIISQL